MKAVVATMMVAVVALLVPAVRAADAKDLVGTWVVEKSDDGAPKGAEVEFTKDGKLKITIEIENKKQTVDGTYKLDGDKLDVIIKTPDGKEDKDALTIKEVTKDKLVILNKDKKETVFKKK